MTNLPHKIEPDAIVEAVLEIRFDAGEPVPDLVVSRLVDNARWRSFELQRTAVYDIPAPVREDTAELRYKPLVNLRDKGSNLKLGISPRMIAMYLPGDYIGWQAFLREIEEMLNTFYRSVESPVIERIGLRYINALTSDGHGVRAITDLRAGIHIDDARHTGPLAMTYIDKLSDRHVVATRIHSPAFTASRVPESSEAIVDIDVYATPEDVVSQEDVMAWIKDAHEYEKQTFFGLLSDEKIEELKADES